MHFSIFAAIATVFSATAVAVPAETAAGAYIKYTTPGIYYMQNAATGTVLDLLDGVAGPNTPLNG